MAIKLIGFPAGYTTKVAVVLEELGLPYEFDKVTKIEDIKTPEFLATKHPFGKVPVLIDDEFVIFESQAIIRYLVNKYQGKKNSTVLIPSDVQKAALVNQFISVEASYYGPPMGKVIYQELVSKFHGQSPNPEIIKEALGEIEKTLDVYEKLLEGKDYLTGEFSLADILHSHSTHLVASCGHDYWNGPKRPNVARWWKKISERESSKKVFTTYKLA